MSTSGIKEHMSVVDHDGNKIGTVDRLEGDKVKLAKSGSGDGQHRYLSCDKVDRVDGETIKMKRDETLPA